MHLERRFGMGMAWDDTLFTHAKVWEFKREIVVFLGVGESFRIALWF
jgi:hypothetical protein